MSENKNVSCELWLQFLNAETEEELDELEATGIPIMQKAVRLLREMSDEPEVQEMVRIREEALRNEASAD